MAKRRFIQSNAQHIPYSDRRAQGAQPLEKWPLEQLVLAQRMECEGRTYDQIAEVMMRPVDEVRRVLIQDDATGWHDAKDKRKRPQIYGRDPRRR